MAHNLLFVLPKDSYALQNVRVDNAVRILKSLVLGSFMAKTDLKSAFRLFPVHPEDWHLLGIYWQQPYVNLYLPFGLHLDLILQLIVSFKVQLWAKSTFSISWTISS